VFIFFLAVSDFIIAPNFGIVINKMRFSGKRKVCCNDEEWLSHKYTRKMLEPKHKADVIKYEYKYVINYVLISYYNTVPTYTYIDKSMASKVTYVRPHFRRIIADSFYEKADLESWLEPKVPYSEYTEVLELLWESLLEKNLR